MKAMTVEPTRSAPEFNFRNTAVLRAILIVLAILPLGCNKDDQPASKAPPDQPPVAQNSQPAPPPAQAMPPQPAPAPAVKPLTDLESLVAPIALYPDPLLAELLVAATYPFEVVQAARWLETKPDLATISSKDWDASIMRLASVPQVIKMLNDHLDWTTQLGDTFLAKPDELVAAIQGLRKRAMDAGYLKETPEQKVTVQTVAMEQTPAAAGAAVQPAVLQKDVIAIKPAKADTVYVPQYNPEVVYQASMAPPPSAAYPASTVVNVNGSAPGYYPTYAPAPTTTTSDDSWMNFGTGALVGGLLTWGIMEWADDDDWDDHHYVGHYYGDSVCHNGNCWHGGGAYYGDRGDVNYNRNTNISGNEINIDRDGNFSQNNLRPAQRPAGWQPNPRHRRGQAYPENVQRRLGATQQPVLAGQRLGAAQTLPSTARGFADAGQRPAAGNLPTQRRPSSADIQRQLAKKPGVQPRPAATKPNSRDVQSQLGQGRRDNALQGIKTPGQASRLESQRGANSRKTAANRQAKPLQPTAGVTPSQRPAAARSKQTQIGQGQARMPASSDRSQQLAAQRRSEAARPNAFEAPRNRSATQNFSQRGASSRQRSAGAGTMRSSGGGGGFRGGGGGRRR